jgi:hypothetical protein
LVDLAVITFRPIKCSNERENMRKTLLILLVTAGLFTSAANAASDSSAWDKTKSGAKEAWSGVKQGSREVWGGMKEGSREAWKGTKEGSREAASGVKTGSKSLWQSIKDVFK